MTTKARDALAETTGDGSFARKASTYKETISTDHPIFKPEGGRYHLYISLACPWANGTYALLKLKGLQEMIGVSIVHPVWQRTKSDDPDDKHAGWVFRNTTDEPVVPVSGYGSIACDGVVPDNINGARSIRELYELSNDTSGKYTVPVLWDKTTRTIVNNESTDILRILNSSFNHLLPEGSVERQLDFFPAEFESAFTETNDWIYSHINNGVYKCGFAKSQSAYSTAFQELFDSLDRVEAVLAAQRYILNNERLHALDIRLFMTLIRFDEVYVVYFKTNRQFVASYPNIRNYMRELYQHPIIQSVINMGHIKNHYFCSHPTLNTYSIVPEGQGVIEDMLLPHDRANK